MNLLTILDKLSDDKFYTKYTSRAGVISELSNFGKKSMIASLPIGLGAFLSTPAKAETKAASPFEMQARANAVVDSLQLALVLEYLEDEYYRIGLQTTGLIASTDRAIFEQISKHENAHVSFLKKAIVSTGNTPGNKPTFDFTAKGNFQPFLDYKQFLTLAQAFEDTGVRAYKGQAANVASNKDVLQAALQIHSVEARHASMVRVLRGNKGWIELADGGNMPSATNGVYAGEELTTQAGYNTAGAFGSSAGSDAYDEPLSTQASVDIASMFIVN